MTKSLKLLNDYWFESLKELLDIIEHWEREWENSLFFWNAIWFIQELFFLSCNLEWQLQQKEFTEKTALNAELLLWKYGKYIEELEEKNRDLKERLKEAKEYMKSDFRF